MNICIFGDSIVWGASDYQNGGWVERLKVYYMKSQDDVDVYNLGISGDNTDDLLKRFKAEAVAREADLIVFAIGVNDSQYNTDNDHRVNIDKFQNNISELTRLASGITDKIIFVGLTRVDESKTMPIPWDTGKNYDNGNIERYDVVIRRFCEKNELDYVDIMKIVEVVDLEDGLHPNSEGHKKMFEKIKAVVDKFLKSNRQN